VPLWRYTDLAKFVDLLTSQRLWLTNLETPWSLLFPHRIWRSFDELPEMLSKQLLDIYGKHVPQQSPQEIFRGWVMLEEQAGIYMQHGRRQYFVNCWHASDHESIAMWKIYGSPGAGIAVVTNGGRLETALHANPERLHLGAVRYIPPGQVEIGTRNSFDPVLVKGKSYEYEQEVRLVFWDTEDRHDPLIHDSWNEETLRFDKLVEDPRPLTPGRLFTCDVDVLIERVIVSPFAPPWYLPMIEKLRDQLNFRFKVVASNLLKGPQAPD
jgi:hypothetical protein